MSTKCLIDESLNKIAYSFKWLGISLEKSRRFEKIYLLHLVMVMTDLAGAIYRFLDGARQGQSFNFFTYAAPCITFCIMANVKAFTLIGYNKRVHELISTLRELEKRRNMFEGRKKEIVDKETEFLNLVLKLLNFFNWVLIVFFPLMPISLTIYNYVQTKEFNATTPLLVMYPFEWNNFTMWPLVCLKQIWSVVYVVLGIASADYIFFICIAYIRLQFKLLAFELEGLRGTPRVLFRDEGFRQWFREIVIWHQRLIHSAELLEAIYTKSTWYNFVSSSVTICLTGFNVMIEEDTALVVSFLSFLFTNLLQIFTLCFFGDMLMRASMEVSDAAYNCEWYSVDIRAAKMIFLVLVRSQTSSKLTALGFADVNLTAFTTIMSTSWSYFALLQTVYSSPRG